MLHRMLVIKLCERFTYCLVLVDLCFCVPGGHAVMCLSDLGFGAGHAGNLNPASGAVISLCVCVCVCVRGCVCEEYEFGHLADPIAGPVC